jgi:hypothetical protein
LVGIWAEGTKLASAETADLDETARIIDRWVASSCSTADLAGSFGCIAIEEVAPSYERGGLAAFHWQQFLNDVRIPELRPFVEAASRRVQLRQLVPYTSLAHFRFYRSAEPHFLPDMPYVVPVEGDRFEVRGASGCVLGRGNAEEAADLVIANLPPGCGTAVPGTADCTEGLWPSRSWRVERWDSASLVAETVAILNGVHDARCGLVPGALQTHRARLLTADLLAQAGDQLGG